MTANDLYLQNSLSVILSIFFITKKFIARKQIFQVTNLCYEARPVFTLNLIDLFDTPKE